MGRKSPPPQDEEHVARPCCRCASERKPIPRLILWLAGVLLLAATVWGVASRSRPATPLRPRPMGPNVLLISVDMLRPDHMGCYGYRRDTSPRADSLAAEGVLFETHISSTSWTLPAHAAMFTGLADSVHGCMDTDKRLADELVTVAEVFRDAGYATAGFYSGPYLHPAFGLGQGFDHYEDCTSYGQMTRDQPVAEWDRDLAVMHKSHEDITSPLVHTAVKRWLDAHGGEPFFMFVHLWDPHFDFIPPAPYDTLFDPEYSGTIDGRNFFFNRAVHKDMPQRDLEHILALYDGEIAWTDLHVGKILDDLAAAGLLDNTVVAFTSDHGTEFFEHGLKGHRQTLFDESIHVPLILRYPAKLPAGLRVPQQTRLIDLAPTLLELAELSFEQDVMGRSLLPLISAAQEAEDPAQEPGHTEVGLSRPAISELFWRTPTREFAMRSLRTTRYKYIDDQARLLTFYVELVTDPGEQVFLWELASGVGAELHARYQQAVHYLDEWRSAVAAGPGRATLTNEQLKRLGAFGYVDVELDEPAPAPVSRPATPGGAD